MRAQGAIEYLIIIAAVLAISAIVVIFVTGAFTGTSGAADVSKCKTAAANCGAQILGGSAACAACDTACVDSKGNEVSFGAIQSCKTGHPAAIIRESAPILGWHLDEASGNLIDSTGHGYVGTVYGATKVQGKSGNALSFDGIDDYVRATPSISQTTGSAVTIEFWMYMDSTGGTSIPFMFNWVTSPRRAFLVSPSPTNPQLQITDLCGETSYAYINPNLENTWTFISLIFRTPNVVDSELYVNGINKTLTYVPHLGCPYNGPLSNNINLGGYSNFGNPNPPAASAYFFKGMIDEFRIYDRALSPAEILAHANA
jgi:hypothetical protein